MASIKQFLTIFICALLCLNSVPGQTTQQQAPQSAAMAQEVTIIIQQQQVRFTAQKAVQEMRLQIFNQSGEVVFDSDPVFTSEIIWPFQNASGETLKSGLYAYALSIKEAGKEAGKETARVRRGHFIVDRAKDQDGRTDRLWVTSQNDANVGTELTAVRSDDATVAGLSTSRERNTDSLHGNAKRDVSGRAVEPETKSAARLTQTAAAAAGTVGQLAKFTTATDLGNSVMTEQSGNIGIGTANPAAKLDVSGIIQSNQGVNSGEFRIGGSTVLSATDGNLLAINAGNFPKVSFPTGSVGIGTTNPQVNLEVFGTGLTEAAVHSRGGQAILALNSEIGGKFQVWTMESGLFAQPGLFGIYDRTAAKARLAIDTNGAVGIGTTNPQVNLEVFGTGLTEAAVHSRGGQAILALNSELGGSARVWTMESGLFAQPGLFGIYDRTAAKARLTIDTNGLVTVNALQLKSGADLAENFDVRAAQAAPRNHSTAEIQPGSVVSIDPADPGKLAVSTRAYDRRVAGVISGAGGIQPGMTMGQAGTLADGKHPVALSGRVYCWVDASFGAIKPGDLLTTSPTPGHAMKVSNSAKAQGAIIGKAMTSLKTGKGLVLVLVTLQ